MRPQHSIRDILDALVLLTGRPEAEIMTEAIGTGLSELYRRLISDAYLQGKVSHEKAVAELGEEIVGHLDLAKDAVVRDVKWGLRGA